MPHSYQYKSLDDSNTGIRLLKLYPGSFNDTIHIKLYRTRLSQTSIPRYEALSYTWGAENGSPTIYIGKKAGSTLRVTHNLYIVLKYLRYKKSSRILWIDSDMY